MRRTIPVVGLIGALVPLVGAAPAYGLSCVGPDEVIPDAEQVFTGRIVDASAGRLLISVEEVWRGAPVEERVWMEVDLPGWSEWSGPDGKVRDGYRSPHTWVFAPYDASVGPCTAWRLDWGPVRRHAPDRPQQPRADGSLDHAGEAAAPTSDDGPLLVAAGTGLGGGAAAAAVALLLLRRRSPRRRSRRRPG